MTLKNQRLEFRGFKIESQTEVYLIKKHTNINLDIFCLDKIN